MTQDFPHLLSPLRVGPKTLRNRVLITGHVPGLAENGAPGEAYIAYHRARARGGAGLQVTGSTAIHPTGGLGNSQSLRNLDDSIIPGYRQLATAVQGEGGAILAQLGHSAATTASSDAGLPLWGPSPVPSQIVREVPHEMTEADIAEILAAYGAATARVREGGLDGIEILGAFGFLPAAFLSPLTNKRGDAYGGSLENRLRFSLEVIDAVRAAAGPDLIVGLRIPGDEKAEGGLTNADMVEIAPALAASGKLDYLNVIAGTNYDRLQKAEHWPPTPALQGIFVALAAAVKQAVDLPVFTTGRITDPKLAEAILRDGKVDMVGMTRAHIADPDIVQKIQTRRAADIRPCVGANVCISRAFLGGPVRCLYNPEAGRELAWGKAAAAAEPKRVAVIGGGPAGLEAARVAAERGHQVTLYERGAQLGGQLRLWAQAPQSREFVKSLDWYEAQLRQLQVRIELAHPVDAAALPALDADALVLATGARPGDRKAFPGEAESDLPIRNPWSVIENPPKGIGHALLYDEGGGRSGLAAAEILIEQGIATTIVSSDHLIAGDVNITIRTPLYKHLLKGGAHFRPNERIARLEGRAVVLTNIYSGIETPIEAVDLLVDWAGNQVVDDLRAAAEASGKELHLAGDCISPRQIHMAVAEGAMAARAI